MDTVVTLDRKNERGETFRTAIPLASFPKSEVDQSIPERFEKIVRQFPEKLAIKQGNTSLNYAELNGAANRLASAILSQKISSELSVAFYLRHGISPLIAILGILKSGSFYLPLDPNFPEDRLAYFLEDSGAQLIITDQECISSAQELSKAKLPLINLDRISKSYSSDNLDLEISPDSLANILYTSGSSGKPKGVPQTHRNLLQSIYILTKNYQLRLDDRISFLFSTSFAASTNPSLGALLNGIALFPFDSKRDLAIMAEWINREEITVLSCVPTLMRHFGSLVAGKVKLPSVRLMTIGGETVLKSDFEIFKNIFPAGCKLRIGLGGSEMLTVTSIILEKSSEVAENIMPVGYSVDDVDIQLVDERGQQVETGQSGEIVVRSRYLSPGYWHRPDLTELKFKADPAGDGLRLYHTGDLGRMRADGCLFHLGRKDFQVKIRGFRVEIEEIEAEISLHPGIQEVAVVTDDHGGREKRLVAYTVPAKDHPAPSVEELRIFLRKKLPDYMIPFAFISIGAMPLTPSGKMDRRALPSLEEVFNLEKDYVAPRDDVEARLVQIWEDLLEVSPIGIKNDFFMIGGHSLLAATLITRLETEFGKRIDFGILSKAPTIEHLAEILRQVDWGASKASLVPIRVTGSRPTIYFVHGLGGHIIPFLQLANHLGTDQPVYALQAREINEAEGDSRTIEGIAADYLSEIRELQPEGPYYLGGFSFGGFVAYEMARQLAVQGKKVGLLAILDTQACKIPGFQRSLSPYRKLRFHARTLWERTIYRLSRVQGQNNHNLHESKLTEQEAIMGDVVEEEIPEHLQLVMRSNRIALRKYVPLNYHGKITLFKSGSHGRGICYGWGELTDGGVEIFEVPGTHRGIMQEPSVAILANKLAVCIEKTLSD